MIRGDRLGSRGRPSVRLAPPGLPVHDGMVSDPFPLSCMVFRDGTWKALGDHEL